jgi:hypothetical protein
VWPGYWLAPTAWSLQCHALHSAAVGPAAAETAAVETAAVGPVAVGPAAVETAAFVGRSPLWSLKQKGINEYSC